jgi:hypothetical protein
MTTPSINIAWSIAEIEASAAGFNAILPDHFWIGCCKGCDLDYAKFLQNAQPEIQNQESRIAQDFQAVRNALAAGKPNPLNSAAHCGVALAKRGTGLPVCIFLQMWDFIGCPRVGTDILHARARILSGRSASLHKTVFNPQIFSLPIVSKMTHFL